MATNDELFEKLRQELDGARNACENALASLRQNEGKNLTKTNVERVGRLIGQIESVVQTAITGTGTGESHVDGIRDFRRKYDNMVEYAATAGLFKVDRIRTKSERKPGAGRPKMSEQEKLLSMLS